MGKTNRTWVWLALIAVIAWFIWGRSEKATPLEEESISAERSPVSATDEDDGQLKDGSYDCTVTNTDRSNGPYSLTCDKTGDEIRITFPNGGYRTISVDDPQQSGHDFTFEGTDDRLSESWEIEIHK